MIRRSVAVMAGALAAVFSSALARGQTWCYVLDTYLIYASQLLHDWVILLLPFNR